MNFFSELTNICVQQPENTCSNASLKPLWHGRRTAPLFVLPMVLFLANTKSCVCLNHATAKYSTAILDERPFGLVMNDPFEPTNGGTVHVDTDVKRYTDARNTRRQPFHHHHRRPPLFVERSLNQHCRRFRPLHGEPHRGRIGARY